MAIDLKYGDRFAYTSYMELAKVATDREIRREYTRLRDIAQKRVKRLGESEFRTGKAYQRNKQGFLTLTEMTLDGQLMRGVFSGEIKKLVGFLTASTSTVSGARAQREKSLSRLQERGYDFIDKDNIQAFGEFMEEFRAEYGRNARGSDEAAELFHDLEEAGIDPLEVKGEFWKWYEHRKEIAEMDFDERVDANYVRHKLAID